MRQGNNAGAIHRNAQNAEPSDFTKTTGKTLKEWTLGKLPKSKKGIFGKKSIGTYRDKQGRLRDEQGRFVKDSNKKPSNNKTPYQRNIEERRKALLRDAKDPNSRLSDRARRQIIKSDGRKAPKGYEVSHEKPLYTRTSNEGKKKLDVEKNMKTQRKSEHRKRHKQCGDQYHKFGPSNQPKNPKP